MTPPAVEDDPTLWSIDRPSQDVLELHERAAGAGLAPVIVEVDDDEIKMRRLTLTLNQWWGNPSHDEVERIAMVARLINRIGSLHQTGICHRDLHSENVMVDDGEIYLIDFDLAQLVDPIWPCYDLTGPSEHVRVPEAHAVQPGHENGIWWGPAVSPRCLVNVVGPQPPPSML